MGRLPLRRAVLLVLVLDGALALAVAERSIRLRADWQAWAVRREVWLRLHGDLRPRSDEEGPD